MPKTRIEVFTGGCPVCDETVKLVNELACPNCEVTVYNLSEACETKSVPTVVVNGKIANCCDRKKPSREELAGWFGINTEVLV